MKRFLAFTLAFTLALTLSACNNNGDSNNNGSNQNISENNTDAGDNNTAGNNPGAETAPETNDEGAPQEVTLSARPGAIDFEDSVFGFIAVDEAPADASKTVSLSVENVFGSNMLKITQEELIPASKPYVAVDASSLLGDSISELRSMELTVATMHPDGTFYSSSGTIIAYCGADRNEVKKPWSVYLDSKNPNLAKFEMTKESEYMVPNAHNFFVFTIDVDSGAGDVILYIDDICFLDANGNVLPVDTSVSFNAPAGFGQMDVSNIWGIAGEMDLGYAGASAGGWGQAIAVDTLKNEGAFNPEWLKPGCVITVFYSSENVPEIILQSWSGGAGWAKVEPFITNESGTIAQFSYDDMVAAYGNSEDFIETLDKFYVGDTGAALDVTKVTIGIGEEGSSYAPEDRSNLLPVKDEFVTGYTGTSPGGWGQAVSINTTRNDDGEFDIEWFKPGCVVTVWYDSEVPPEIIVQSWTSGAPVSWAKTEPAAVNDSGSICQFTYYDMAEAFGTENFADFFDKFNIGDCGAELTVIKVSIGQEA